MRLHRFYVVQPLGEDVVIDDVSQVFQWTKVFRYTAGDFVILFNGDGNDYCYSIQELSKKTCSLTRTKSTPSYIPKRKIALYLSVIKKDNFELAVQKATELGVTSIIPVLSTRSEKKHLSMERLQKIAIEASEQCLRGDIPHICEIISLEEALKTLPKEVYSIMFTMDEPLLTTSNDSTSNTAVFIGPEGGFDEDEIALMKEHGLHGYSLGNTVLRAETAAIAACVAINLLA